MGDDGGGKRLTHTYLISILVLPVDLLVFLICISIFLSSTKRKSGSDNFFGLVLRLTAFAEIEMRITIYRES